MNTDLPSPAVDFSEKIRRLQGPILVLGASGFVGANLLRSVLAVRSDAHGTTSRKPAWRLEDLRDSQVHLVDLLIDSNLDGLLDRVKPRTVFNCVAYGAYSFETDSQLIYRTNFNLITRLLPRLESLGDRVVRPRGQFLGVRRQRARVPPSEIPSPRTAITPSPRSPRPISSITTASENSPAPTSGFTRSTGRSKTPPGLSPISFAMASTEPIPSSSTRRFRVTSSTSTMSPRRSSTPR